MCTPSWPCCSNDVETSAVLYLTRPLMAAFAMACGSIGVCFRAWWSEGARSRSHVNCMLFALVEDCPGCSEAMGGWWGGMKECTWTTEIFCRVAEVWPGRRGHERISRLPLVVLAVIFPHGVHITRTTTGKTPLLLNHSALPLVSNSVAKCFARPAFTAVRQTTSPTLTAYQLTSFYRARCGGPSTSSLLKIEVHGVKCLPVPNVDRRSMLRLFWSSSYIGTLERFTINSPMSGLPCRSPSARCSRESQRKAIGTRFGVN